MVCSKSVKGFLRWDLTRRWTTRVRLTAGARSRARRRAWPISFSLLDHYRYRDAPAERAAPRVAGDAPCRARLSAQAHTELMCREPGMHEYQLAAIFGYHCRMAGAPSHAYPSIVWEAQHELCPALCRKQQTAERRRFGAGVDAGCEIECHTPATRTYPVNGRFSEPHHSL